ncbi:MAG: hypothetical protein LBK47_08380 [Prevotellaceae bacterium]|jgi:arginyl-tRNA synthetase|nr:hypothetical protein [Prevotellaceae bacterium]
MLHTVTINIDDSILSSARLKLVEGVVIIIHNGLNLLGVSIPEKM